MRTVEVKICGVTRPEDGLLAAELGAKYVGLNFWPKSPRFVPLEQARRIVQSIGGRAIVVGVFVDATESWIREVDAEVGLDLLQFHGDESPERLVPFGDRAIKVFRIADAFDPVELERYPEAAGWLFDVRHAEYGGTGKSWSYELVRGLTTDRPVMVAGGVRPSTVADVVDRCQPTVVDVCSGVESSPGIKEKNLMVELFEEIEDDRQVRLA